jgi:hypothetical protein
MAFKVTVDYTNFRIIIDSDAVTFTKAESLLQYVNISTANVILDADTKNLYFSSQYDSPNAETLNISESLAKAVQFARAFSDTPSVTEELTKAVSTTAADSTSVSESLARTVEFVRAFSDSPSISESLAKATTFARTFSDTPSITDSPAKAVSNVASDSTTVSEALTKIISPAFSDSPSVSESFSRAVTYERTFADAHTLDDLASASDNLQTDFNLNKGNVFGFTDDETIQVGKSGIADTPSISEVLAHTFNKNPSDSATISESVSILFITGSDSVLNTTALNTSVLN